MGGGLFRGDSPEKCIKVKEEGRWFLHGRALWVHFRCKILHNNFGGILHTLIVSSINFSVISISVSIICYSFLFRFFSFHCICMCRLHSKFSWHPCAATSPFTLCPYFVAVPTEVLDESFAIRLFRPYLCFQKSNYCTKNQLRTYEVKEFHPGENFC